MKKRKPGANPRDPLREQVRRALEDNPSRYLEMVAVTLAEMEDEAARYYGAAPAGFGVAVNKVSEAADAMLKVQVRFATHE